MRRLCRLEVRSSNQKWLLILGLLPTTSCREQPAAARLAERVSKSVYIALIRERSPTFKKHKRHRHELCAGPHVRSPQFACNLHANMGRSMGENVRRKVGVDWVDQDSALIYQNVLY